MTQQHPIVPPPDKIHNWIQLEKIGWSLEQIIALAAQWGSDQELEACCEWINSFQNKFVHAHDLRLVRRPKPPSLKEQALECLKNINDACESEGFSRSDDTDIIRRALESLPS
jgi:hypothetical protein